MLQYLCCLHNRIDGEDPPPPYEEVDPEEYLPLGVLYLCGKQREFPMVEAVDIPGFCMLIASTARLPASRLAANLFDTWRLGSLMTASPAYSVTFTSAACYLENKNIYTHVAILGGKDEDFITLYSSWNHYMRFPSLDCFMALIHRTGKRSPSSCLIINLSADFDIADRIFYYHTC